MPYPPPLEARVVLIDGPVSLFLHPAPEKDLLDAFARIARLFRIAASQLDSEAIVTWTEPANPVPPGGSVPFPPNDRGGGPWGEGGP